MSEGLAGAQQLCEELGEIFCLTFVRGVEPGEVLRRMGAYPETFAQREPAEVYERTQSFDAGYPYTAGVVWLEGWTVVVELEGHQLAGSLLGEVSRGTEAVSVLRHDYASPRFAYSVDGVEMVGFDPSWMGQIWGQEPDRLGAVMRDVGLRPIDPDGEEPEDEPDDMVERAVWLAASVAGVMPAVELLTAPMLTADFEPWFTGAEPADGRVSADPSTPRRDALDKAVTAATPRAKRAVAVAEVRRMAAVLGIDSTPGLTEALDRAAQLPGKAAQAGAGERGGVVVAPDSPLGVQVRGWLRAGSIASSSLNTHDRHRMSEAERQRGYLFGWFTGALRGALYPDPDIAVRTALYALAWGPAPLATAEAQAAVLHHLRSRS